MNARARLDGATEFELQFLQNIQVPGAYFSAEQQHRVAVFGQAAYAAFGTVLADLGKGTRNIAVDHTCGSNGCVMFAKAREAWSGYVHHIGRTTWVDGRTLQADAEAALRAPRARRHPGADHQHARPHVRFTRSPGRLAADR